MQSDKKQILNRLATIDGHLKGIRKMVEADQYCVDILKQCIRRRARPQGVRSRTTRRPSQLVRPDRLQRGTRTRR